MLYLKLKQHLTTERAAIASMQTFAGFNGLISPRRTREADGSAKALYVVLVPGGRRPSSVLTQLRTIASHTDWTLIDVVKERKQASAEHERVVEPLWAELRASACRAG